MPVRVLLIIPTLDQSGAEKQLSLLATRLPPEEFTVHVVALTRGGPYAAELERFGIPCTILRKRGKLDPLCWWRLRKLVRSFQPDVIHTWLFAGNAYGRLASGGRKGPPVIVSERCVDSWKASWQHWLDRWLLPRTARLVGNSQSVAAFYRQRGVPDSKLRVIPNGIEIPPISERSREERDRMRQIRWNIPPGALAIGFVGRLARQKRVEDLVWAVTLLDNFRKDVYLVLVGDGPERERLADFARAVNVEDRVLFLGHQSNPEHFWPFLDLFVLPSDFEGMSNSLMEAMARGLPAVVSDIAPNRELVTDGQTGLLFPVGDRGTLARQLQRLANDAPLARQLGQSARAQMSQHFSVESMVALYAALYREVLPK